MRAPVAGSFASNTLLMAPKMIACGTIAWDNRLLDCAQRSEAPDISKHNHKGQINITSTICARNRSRMSGEESPMNPPPRACAACCRAAVQ